FNNCDPFHPCAPFGPYVEGRISNGPVATEYLADSLFPGGVTGANFNSYAVAGATSGVGNYGDGGTALEPGNLLPGPIPLSIPGILPLPGMRAELEQYMSDSNGNADPDALYFLWGGANDYLAHENLTTVEAARLAAQNIGGYVSELAEAGARHFLVPNRADLSSTPFVSAMGEPAKSDARTFSLEFNEELAAQLAGVSAQFPAADIFQFDTYSFLNGVIANPLSYGFTDVQNSCLALDCGDAGNADSFLYWDDFHPTTYAHSVIASAFASAVPEPEIFAMLIGGLFVLGIAASRRRELAQPCNLVEQTA
ncbi:MAG: SGNH/GDSL hydrolase family protein, partial [Nitrosospira sp.]|nr:SGNH/GDSL hydrolase family protein [Nitrosospira sp.]